MHPIEHLRHVARLDDAPPEWLIPEAAEALHGLIGDRNALVMGCRKLLEYQTICGPMWWLCGHVLGSRDPHRTLDDLIRTFDQDPTRLQLSLALADVDPHGPGAPRILEAALAAAGGVIVSPLVSARSTAARTRADEIWVVAGVGTVVPGEVFAVVTEGIQPDGRLGAGRRQVVEVVDIGAITRVIRPTGVSGVEVLHTGSDVPFIPELLARR